jgi:hypothetical protein
VAARLLEGLTSKEIGKALEISHRTVEIYRARLMRKYNASTAADLVHKLLAGAESKDVSGLLRPVDHLGGRAKSLHRRGHAAVDAGVQQHFLNLCAVAPLLSAPRTWPLSSCCLPSAVRKATVIRLRVFMSSPGRCHTSPHALRVMNS